MLTQKEALELQELLYKDSLEIMLKKRKDYSGDIDPFGNLRLAAPLAGVEPWRGVLVRLGDKFSRLRNILDRDGAMYVQDEMLWDVFCDIINYTCILAGLCAEELNDKKLGKKD